MFGDGMLRRMLRPIFGRCEMGSLPRIPRTDRLLVRSTRLDLESLAWLVRKFALSEIHERNTHKELLHDGAVESCEHEFHVGRSS